jgi:hypothetical protein
MPSERVPRPLGVRPEVLLSEGQLRTLQILEGYDISPVRNHLLNSGVMPPSWVDEALLEFRRFLGLQVIAPGPRIMFSTVVDHAWHTCLLFTRLYAAYCQQAFGYFFHHDPATDLQQDRDQKFREFEQLYETTYGPVNRLWYMANRDE